MNRVDETLRAGRVPETRGIMADWNLEGTYFEACNCDVVCPCLFLSDPTDDDWYCISELTMDDTDAVALTPDGLVPVTSIKLKAERKQAALKLVGDHINVQAFKERVEHTGLIGITPISAEEFKQARREMLINDDC